MKVRNAMHQEFIVRLPDLIQFRALQEFCKSAQETSRDSRQTRLESQFTQRLPPRPKALLMHPSGSLGRMQEVHQAIEIDP